jgi:hypothetical protein
MPLRRPPRRSTAVAGAPAKPVAPSRRRRCAHRRAPAPRRPNAIGGRHRCRPPCRRLRAGRRRLRNGAARDPPSAAGWNRSPRPRDAATGRAVSVTGAGPPSTPRIRAEPGSGGQLRGRARAHPLAVRRRPRAGPAPSQEWRRLPASRASPGPLPRTANGRRAGPSSGGRQVPRRRPARAEREPCRRRRTQPVRSVPDAASPPGGGPHPHRERRPSLRCRGLPRSVSGHVPKLSRRPSRAKRPGLWITGTVRGAGPRRCARFMQPQGGADVRLPFRLSERGSLSCVT